MSRPNNYLEFPRVTSIIDNVLAPKGHLLTWVREKERSGFDTLAFMTEKADAGTAVHEGITKMLLGEKYECPKGWDGKFKAVQEYLKGATNLIIEEAIWDEDATTPYRGTPDLYFERDGHRYVVDWKTGRPGLRHHATQLHAYRAGVFARTGKLADRLAVVYLGKNGINFDDKDKYDIYLDKTSIQPVEVPVQDGLWEALLLQYAYYNS